MALTGAIHTRQAANAGNRGFGDCWPRKAAPVLGFDVKPHNWLINRQHDMQLQALRFVHGDAMAVVKEPSKERRGGHVVAVIEPLDVPRCASPGRRQGFTW